MPAKLIETLTLDLSTNRIQYGGKSHSFKRRYEAAFLACLEESGAQSATTAVAAATIQRVLAGLGQTQPLNRKQFQRLLDGIEAGLVAVGLNEPSAKIESPNLNRTIGPWWWPARALLRVDVPQRNQILQALAPPDPVGDHGAPKYHLAKDGTLASTRRIVWLLFYADAHAWDGAFAEVVDIIEDNPIWKLASPDAAVLLHLRLAKAHKTLRDFKSARHHFDKARTLTNASATLRVLHAAQIDHHAERQRYNQSPVEAAQLVRTALTGHIAQLLSGAKQAVNPWLLGSSYNLRGLTLRRAIEALPADAAVKDATPLVTACLNDFISALYCVLCTRDLETTQNIASNIAYAIQQIALRGWLPAGKGKSAKSGEEVFDWYRIAFAWHTKFLLADNTAWEYIFLGEYWLRAKAERANFLADSALREPDEKLDTYRPIWQGKLPNQLAFYEFALARADQIGDPRQIVFAALNQCRFCEEFGHRVARGRAIKAIESACRKDANIRTVVEAEGYVFPTDA